MANGIVWNGHRVATLAAGPSLARPRIVLERDLDCLDKAARARIADRLAAWLAARMARDVPVLGRLAEAARDPAATPALRIVAAALEEAGGMAPRAPLRASLDSLSSDERRRLRQMGVTIGALDLFDARLLKPVAAAMRAALLGVRGVAPAAPPPGATVLARGSPGATTAAGFRPLAAQAVRVDLVERIARAAHDARAGRAPFAPDPALSVSIGMAPASLDRLMAEIGFRSVKGESPRWVWRGRPPVRATVAPPPPDNAFAALAALRHG